MAFKSFTDGADPEVRFRASPDMEITAVLSWDSTFEMLGIIDTKGQPRSRARVFRDVRLGMLQYSREAGTLHHRRWSPRPALHDRRGSSSQKRTVIAADGRNPRVALPATPSRDLSNAISAQARDPRSGH